MRLPARPNGRVAAFLFSCLTALVAHTATAAPAEPPPIFVLNSLDANVSVINPVDWTEKLRIPTGKEPHHIYMTPDEKSVIVANSAGDSLTFLNPKTAEVQRVVYGIIDPYQLQFSRDMKWFVTAGNRLNHVDVYRWDGKELKLAKRIASGKTPSHIWIDNTSTIAYVTMQDSDEMIAVDLPTQTIRWRVATGAMPADIYGIHNDKTLLVGLTGSDGVQVFDVAGTEPKLVGKIPTGKGAHAFRSAGDGKSVFVSNRVANTISRIDIATLKVSATYAVPGGPDCMDVSADGKTLYVTSRWAKKLSVIDLATQKVVRQVNVGRSPHGVWTLDHAKRI
ncbi:beta-propeller fold lactonase family protein [Variovorax sp. RKNM96]|uniref:YncE family protein n=1 Tax=Variovorax sp. RKNM96 TaxID=2681552 RepID=UPI00197FD178|nr:beta-propeller fold lactonase family protein [Variovorax sp. RKNM96]QSI29737.1 beta-propeller fold lactonase family protein [Variovorax sp. RKNM96]